MVRRRSLQFFSIVLGATACSPDRPGTNSDSTTSITSASETPTDATSGPSTTSGAEDATSTSDPASGSATAGIDGSTDAADDDADTTTSSTDATSGEEGSSGGPAVLDCDAQMPASGAAHHSGNGQGGDDNLAWQIWSNTGMGELTTYDVPAFSAIWNQAGGYLGRLGYEWGGFMDNPVPHDQVGTISAQFVSRKMGNAGTYSYIGMYGWSTDPCVEWYVVEDSFNTMPINPGNTTNMGEVEIDGGTYIMYTRPTTGSGGTRCAGVNNWIQYYSVRTTARDCGEISLTQHFEAWDGLGMPLGDLLEAKILVEVGGGTGRVDLPVANVTLAE